MIKKELINKKLSCVQKYFVLIDEDIFIDYLCFFYEKDEAICITLDSSAENISIINLNDLKKSIKTIAIKYFIEEITKEIFLKEIYYTFDQYDQLEKIDFIFDSEILKVFIGLDSLNYEFYTQ